jgi:hypothetical protein
MPEIATGRAGEQGHYRTDWAGKGAGFQWLNPISAHGNDKEIWIARWKPDREILAV